MKLFTVIRTLMRLPIDVKIARIAPDDVIVVKVDAILSDEETAMLVHRLALIWPNRKIAVFGNDVRLHVLRNAEAI